MFKHYYKHVVDNKGQSHTIQKNPSQNSTNKKTAQRILAARRDIGIPPGSKQPMDSSVTLDPTSPRVMGTPVLEPSHIPQDIY